MKTIIAHIFTPFLSTNAESNVPKLGVKILRINIKKAMHSLTSTIARGKHGKGFPGYLVIGLLDIFYSVKFLY